MSEILVTGGAGLIGSNLCRKLLELGNSVIIYDNLMTSDYNNIKDIVDDKTCKFVETDLSQNLDIKLSVDQIYNLACPASPIHYRKDPIKTMMTSVNGANNVLKLATKLNIPVLQTSTSEVYGDPLVHPQSEEYRGNVNTLGPRACYDEGKRSAETLFMDYNRTYGTKTKIVRIFNTYGPYMHANDGRVVSNFILQALHNEDITMYGDGNQTRSFCYVDDTVDALIRMMNSSSEILGPINIGRPAENTMIDLAKLVIELTGSKSKIIYKELPIDDPIRRKPDITKATNLLNWIPKTDLKTGLISTINYFKSVEGYVKYK